MQIALFKTIIKQIDIVGRLSGRFEFFIGVSFFVFTFAFILVDLLCRFDVYSVDFWAK